MANIFITGSSDGLGLMAGRLLAEQGHDVVLHARSDARAEATRAALPRVAAVMVGDVSTLTAMHDVAEQANKWGRFDAVIHNVGFGYREPRRVETVDGLSRLWAVNVLAPYVLTARMLKPDRLVYLSSDMHRSGDLGLDDLQWSQRPWDGIEAYADTKLHDVLLAFGVARHWPDILSNVVTPGWVATRMGGPDAPDDLGQGHLTQVWLAVSNAPRALVTGQYFHHKRPQTVGSALHDPALQDRLLDYCRRTSGVALPI